MPTIYLPVPDPTSFPLLIHYMYFGKVEYMDRGLHAGEIQWEGVVRNVEYLGLGPEIKSFLGSWWRRWIETGDSGSGRQNMDPIVLEEIDDDSEDDDIAFTDDFGDDMSAQHAFSSAEMDMASTGSRSSGTDEELAFRMQHL